MMLAAVATLASCSLVMDPDRLRVPPAGDAADAGAGSPDGGPAVLFAEDFEALPIADRWADDSLHGAWRCVYSGNGASGIELAGTHVHTERPATATGSALTATTRNDFADIDVTLRVSTLEQLRASADRNEAATLLWRYDAANDAGYYFAVGPGGWELGRRSKGTLSPLASGGEACALGATCTLRVRHVGASVTSFVDGRPAASLTGATLPAGQIGLYVDGAHVHFDDLVVRAP